MDILGNHNQVNVRSILELVLWRFETVPPH
jgi:hypothetical protein